MEDEEHRAAKALSGVLTSVMLHQAAPDGIMPRTWLYGWERDGLQWLIRFQTRRPWDALDNGWMPKFLELNRKAILDGDEMNFNLRAARLAKESAA